MITGETRLAAVIGSPVRHSLSPAIHNAGFESTGADWRMVALDVAAGETRAAIHAMRTLGIGGLAVTMPHKEAAAAAVDEIDAAARALESVNTVVLRSDGSTHGASTDGAGFVASLGAAGVKLAGRQVVVFGAGGAARSIVDALGRAGVDHITIVNRSRDRADRAAELAPCASVGEATDAGHADIVVNATPVGMGAAADDTTLPFDPTLLRAGIDVIDIVYHPIDTSLLRAARAAGCRTVDGLGMLVEQACLQQELWTGSTPDPATMRAAAETELARAQR